MKPEDLVEDLAKGQEIDLTEDLVENLVQGPETAQLQSLGEDLVQDLMDPEDPMNPAENPQAVISAGAMILAEDQAAVAVTNIRGNPALGQGEGKPEELMQR